MEIQSTLVPRKKETPHSEGNFIFYRYRVPYEGASGKGRLHKYLGTTGGILDRRTTHVSIGSAWTGLRIDSEAISQIRFEVSPMSDRSCQPKEILTSVQLDCMGTFGTNRRRLACIIREAWGSESIFVLQTC